MLEVSFHEATEAEYITDRTLKTTTPFRLNEADSNAHRGHREVEDRAPETGFILVFTIALGVDPVP